MAFNDVFLKPFIISNYPQVEKLSHSKLYFTLEMKKSLFSSGSVQLFYLLYNNTYCLKYPQILCLFLGKSDVSLYENFMPL